MCNVGNRLKNEARCHLWNSTMGIKDPLKDTIVFHITHSIRKIKC